MLANYGWRAAFLAGLTFPAAALLYWMTEALAQSRQALLPAAD